MLKISDLNDEERKRCQSFVPKEFHQILEGRAPRDCPDSTEIYGFVDPTGIVLASAIPEHDKLLIHYLHSPDVERFLEKMEGIKPFIEIHYEEDNPFAAEIAEACKKRGWSGPLLHSTTFLIEIQRLHPDWLEKEYSFAKKMYPFRWVKLSRPEEKRLRLELDQGRINKASSPFDWEDPLEPLNSLGLTFHGKTVGWMVNHRVDKDTIRYTSLYTYPEYRYKGDIIKLLIQSIKEQQKSTVPYALFEVTQFGVDLKWREFVNKRLAPYAKRITKKFTCWRS